MQAGIVRGRWAANVVNLLVLGLWLILLSQILSFRGLCSRTCGDPQECRWRSKRMKQRKGGMDRGMEKVMEGVCGGG